VGAIACHRLIDRVVDGLIDQMVQTLFADVTNIHCGAFAHGLKAFEHLDIARGIVLFLNLLFFCQHIFICRFTYLAAKVRKKSQINIVYLLKNYKNKTAALSGCGSLFTNQQF